MSSQPETEVISCPACKHLVRVPLDWLGQQVQCPECKAMFRAPLRVDGKLTEPELLSRPSASGVASRKRPDVMLLLPAFGLMLVGLVGLVVGGVNTVRYLKDANAAKQDVLQLIQESRKRGWMTEGPEQADEQAKFDEELAEKRARPIRVLVPVFAVVSGLVFYGGVAIATRRHYRIAKLACVLAVVNIAHGCCFPGAIVGLWGLLMLNSDEGREHFLR
ncbi:MAG: hypothetical protein L0241_12540 [Planctomycetia bacterium]|nr:hypothetical protein [Planctomycetia bacterium]